MTAAELLQISESWRSIIKREQGFVEKNDYVVAEKN